MATLGNTNGKDLSTLTGQTEQGTKEKDSTTKPDLKSDQTQQPPSEGKTEEGNKPSGSKIPHKEVIIGEILNQESPEISKLVNGLSKLEQQKEDLQTAIKEKRLLLKPVTTSQKRRDGNKGRPSREKRKALKVEVKLLKRKLLWVKDEIEVQHEKLNGLLKNETSKLDEEKLRDQSNSIAFIKKNEYSIKTRLLERLNGVLGGSDEILKDSFEAVRRLAFKESDEGKKEFVEALALLLKNTDKKLFILSSGKLKNKLYGAVRQTLQKWLKDENKISRLVFPEDLEEERKTAPDPFEKSRPLITSLILRFFNGLLSDEKTKKELLGLRALAKDQKKKGSFYKQIDEFVDREDAEVYLIGAGGARDRLNETLRLTLLNWQPELKGSFEEIVIASPENHKKKAEKKASKAKSPKTSKTKNSSKKKSTKTKK